MRTEALCSAVAVDLLIACGFVILRVFVVLMVEGLICWQVCSIIRTSGRAHAPDCGEYFVFVNTVKSKCTNLGIFVAGLILLLWCSCCRVV